MVLFDQGQVDEAQSEHEAVYLAFRNLHGEDHETTLACRYNGARVLHRCGRLADAEAAFRSVLEVLRRTPNRRVPLIVQNNLGRVLYGRGDVRAARAEFEAVLSAQRELLRADHPDLLRTRHNQELRAVIELQEQTLGTDHDETSQTRRNLAGLMPGISDAGC